MANKLPDFVVVLKCTRNTSRIDNGSYGNHVFVCMTVRAYFVDISLGLIQCKNFEMYLTEKYLL